MRASLLAVALAVGSLGSSVAAAPEADDASLRDANAREVAAFMAVDVKALEGLWADGMVVTNPLNQFVTKSQVLGMVASGVLRFASYDRKIEYIGAYGDIAIVAGAESVVWAGKMPMAGQSSRLRFTGVWQRSGSGWREVARHANIIPSH